MVDFIEWSAAHVDCEGVREMISTRDLTQLPGVEQLRAAFQSMAMLDAIIEPEWQYRYYSFEVGPGPHTSCSIGSMRNGSGDDLHAIFGLAGCLVRGFAHEYEMSPYAEDPPRVYPGILEDVPPEFADHLATLHSDWWHDITFCIWRRQSDSGWHHGRIDFPELPDPDGSEMLLSAYDGRPETYRAWAERYYSQPGKINIDMVRWVFDHRPLTEAVVRALNADRSLADLTEELAQIGYPDIAVSLNVKPLST
jgi:hypothetical protein